MPVEKILMELFLVCVLEIGIIKQILILWAHILVYMGLIMEKCLMVSWLMELLF